MPKKQAIKEPAHLIDLKIEPDPRVLGLDLSLTATGWANWNSPGEVSSGIIETDLKGPARLKHIRDLIKYVLVSEGTPSQSLILLENYAFGKANQAHQMGELGGVVRTMLYEEKYKFFVIPPTRLKKFLTGKGVAEKNLMLKELYKHFGHDADNDNIADALVLMELGRAMIDRPSKELPKYRQEVVQEVIKDLSKIEE
jgi:crossover junction endodeoxyribonuclease RuvC